ncbi:MAG: TetR/AcrR family transcriptional regulator [Porticoccaceae bacterium]|jgi:AcrR family transcriptional regulator|nr:TetR/AcrR family transcriptional regulator [Porticoccaceae bacterium]
MQPPTTALPGKRERTRAAIVNAAITLIAEKGLESSSIDDLMATAGMARGTFYNYFQCREEVLFSVIREIQDQLISKVVSHIPADLPPAQVVACMLNGYLQFCQDECRIGAVMIRIGGFSPWVDAEDQSMREGFSRIDAAVEALCGNRVSFTSARTYLEGMSNNILCHLLGGRIGWNNVEELVFLTLRGLGMPEREIDKAVAAARGFAASIAKAG